MNETLLDFSETNEFLKYKTLKDLQQACSNCTKCELSKTRTNVVFGDGNFNAKLMLIGEAPGKNEDEKGLPFVGRSGQLLEKFLLTQEITREKNIYICNIIKCRPPNNRPPSKKESTLCKNYLEAQIQILKPSIIILAGATAVKNILSTKEPISKIRGQWFDGPFNSKIIPIFHPSYLLRNHSQEKGTPRWLMLQDIQKIKSALNSIH